MLFLFYLLFIKEAAKLLPALIINQHTALEWFLKDHVTQKTGIIAFTHINKWCLKKKTVTFIVIIFNDSTVFSLFLIK